MMKRDMSPRARFAKTDGPGKSQVRTRHPVIAKQVI